MICGVTIVVFASVKYRKLCIAKFVELGEIVGEKESFPCGLSAGRLFFLG